MSTTKIRKVKMFSTNDTAMFAGDTLTRKYEDWFMEKDAKGILIDVKKVSTSASDKGCVQNT